MNPELDSAYDYGDGDTHLCNLCDEYTGTEEFCNHVKTYYCKGCHGDCRCREEEE